METNRWDIPVDSALIESDGVIARVEELDVAIARGHATASERAERGSLEALYSIRLTQPDEWPYINFVHDSYLESYLPYSYEDFSTGELGRFDDSPLKYIDWSLVAADHRRVGDCVHYAGERLWIFCG